MYMIGKYLHYRSRKISLRRNPRSFQSRKNRSDYCKVFFLDLIVMLA